MPRVTKCVGGSEPRIPRIEGVVVEIEVRDARRHDQLLREVEIVADVRCRTVSNIEVPRVRDVEVADGQAAFDEPVAHVASLAAVVCKTASRETSGDVGEQRKRIRAHLEPVFGTLAFKHAVEAAVHVRIRVQDRREVVRASELNHRIVAELLVEISADVA